MELEDAQGVQNPKLKCYITLFYFYFDECLWQFGSQSSSYSLLFKNREIKILQIIIKMRTGTAQSV